MISLRSVTYYYPNRNVAALKNVDLDIRAGEFVLVTGSSGSGKSTLLRTLNGLVPHFSGGRIGGSVSVDGLDAVKEGPQVLSRHAGFVAQVPEDQSLMGVVEAEVAFALENVAMPRTQMHERVHEALELVGLAHLRHRRIMTLSGGERQRVAIACALALKPKVLILDEPTSQLDPHTAETVLQTLRSLQENHNLTIVVAEHRLERVLPYVDSIAVMENGRVLEHGSVHQTLSLAPYLPPVAELARELGWQSLPLTVEEGSLLVADADLVDSPDDIVSTFARTDRPNQDHPLLQTKDLSFSYEKTEWAIEGIDLFLRRGELLAIIGPNGSGKSTVLKAIVALITPQRGDILQNGQSILGEKTVDLASHIAYLPQNPDDMLFAETVRQEFEITLQNHGFDAGTQVDELLSELGLTELAGAYPRDLSTGQRQRVALGAVTITRPAVVLLDEPTRGLDGRVKDQLVALWQSWKAAGMGIVVVTHDVELAAQVADRVIVLDNGRVMAAGPARGVLGNQPAFAPQIARLFPDRGWITVQDAVKGLQSPQKSLL